MRHCFEMNQQPTFRKFAVAMIPGLQEGASRHFKQQSDAEPTSVNPPNLTQTLPLIMILLLLQRYPFPLTYPNPSAGGYLMVGSGSNVYGGVDWVSIGLSAPEHVDLRNPKARLMSRCQLWG